MDGVKKQMTTLSETYFAADEQQVLDIMVGAKSIVTELVDATKQFKTALQLKNGGDTSWTFRIWNT